MERRGGQEDRLQDLGAVGEGPQAGAQPLAVGGEGVFQPLGQPLGIAGRGRGFEPLAEGLQLLEGEQGGAVRKEAGGGERTFRCCFSHEFPVRNR